VPAFAATPDQVAYRQFDEISKTWVSFTWAQVASEVPRWQAALAKEGLAPGESRGGDAEKTASSG